MVETANVVKEQGVINYSVRHPIGIAGIMDITLVCKYVRHSTGNAGMTDILLVVQVLWTLYWYASMSDIPLVMQVGHISY